MISYSRFPLGATVVAVTSLITCTYIIITTSYILANYGWYLHEDCNSHMSKNDSLLSNFGKLLMSGSTPSSSDSNLTNFSKLFQSRKILSSGDSFLSNIGNLFQSSKTSSSEDSLLTNFGKLFPSSKTPSSQDSDLPNFSKLFEPGKTSSSEDSLLPNFGQLFPPVKTPFSDGFVNFFTSSESKEFFKLINKYFITKENCEDLIKGVIALIAWDCIITLLFVFSAAMMVGIFLSSTCLVIPYMLWLPVVIVFILAVAIVMSTKLASKDAAVTIIVAIALVVIPCYYWVVAFMHRREAAKERKTSTDSQMFYKRKDESEKNAVLTVLTPVYNEDEKGGMVGGRDGWMRGNGYSGRSHEGILEDTGVRDRK